MYCTNCGEKIKEGENFCGKCGKPREIQSGPAIKYFAISPKRLALLSILTLGTYEIYWFYKNWEAVKKAEGQKVSPFWRAIFVIFYCHSLFKKVLASAKSSGYQNSYSPGWLATAYILLLLVINGLGNVESYDIWFNLLWLIIASTTFIPLLAIQKAINFNNGKIKGDAGLKREFSGGEVGVVVVGAILFLLVLWVSFLP